MDVKPIKHYRKPTYPTRSAVDMDPSLLRMVPGRWQGKAIVLTALAATCGIVAARWAVPHNPPPKAQQPSVPQFTPPAVSRVAPIFVHGEGRGVYGCYACIPPAFLSEEEALEVIQQEFTGVGLDCTPTQHAVDVNVTVVKHEHIRKHTRDAIDEKGDHLHRPMHVSPGRRR